MLKRLQQKWGVSSSQFIFILCVFAITGSSTAWITKVITAWVGFTGETFWLWKFLLRLGMLILGYQAILLLVAFLFGQFPFFWKYEKKILKRLGIAIDQEGEKTGMSRKNGKGKTLSPPKNIVPNKINTNMEPEIVRPASNPQPKEPGKRIAIFASGTGSNAQKIIDHFRKHPSISVALIASNKPGAGVLDIAEKESIPSLIIEKERFFRGDSYISDLKTGGIQWIILAGFLWKVPVPLINAFPGRIINIHPALLPKYGGKGMYGHFVHEAVIAAKEKESGITIHYVDEQFDHGKPVFQVTCPVSDTDTPETLAKKIQVLEHTHYPEVIARIINTNVEV
ncbi:phosphoribosylglycinamide formyltransferase [Agriterribacter sp.]|uniref:phosphoribosylglycinamide formyltransferase n=1 Tax=Agriterribacter sp. TaxID=2821509 RepID=UPI002C8205E2|nr:phosphoribosylglycinamide formyltransferase [Agriterribacter sp.]HTN08621.1 phosphoribosylglycinamide formyltransferase [Agriterribacter sp.]